MILSNNSIQKYVDKGEIVITPFNRDHLKAASYTLTLGECLYFIDNNGNKVSKNISSEPHLLKPNEFILGETEEHIRFNGKFAGILSTRGSCAQRGIHVLLGSIFIEPDTDNKIILEIVNESSKPVELTCGMKIVKCVFMKVT